MGERSPTRECRHPRLQAAGTEHPVHAALVRCVHSMLASETGWRMKQAGEAIGPAEATQEMVDAHEVCSARGSGAEAVGLLAVHDLMSEAEVSGTVLGHSISSVVIRCACGRQ